MECDICGRLLLFLLATHMWYTNVQVKGEPEKGWMVLESEEEGVELLLSLAKVSLISHMD